jgi:hypothetical protein
MSNFLDDRRGGQRAPLTLDAPALATAGWLPPDTGWETMDDLRAEHTRILGVVREITDERSTATRRYEAEDKAADEALYNGFREGADAKPVEQTPDDERRATLADLDKRFEMARVALDEFLREAIEKIEAEAPVWVNETGARLTEAKDKREEAARLVAEAQGIEDTAGRLTEWVQRTGGIHRRAAYRNIPAVRFTAWDAFTQMFTPAPTPGPEDALLQRLSGTAVGVA